MLPETDPYRAYNFKLEIQGIVQGHFTECSGLQIKVDAISYREAGNNQVVRRIPGQVTYGDVVLRYGLTSSRELWDWLKTVVSGEVGRKNVSIILVDSSGSNEVMRWNLINAWPSEWQGASLNALNSRDGYRKPDPLVFETLERA